MKAKVFVVAVFVAVMAAGVASGMYISEPISQNYYYDEGNDGDSWETAYIIDSVENFLLMRMCGVADEGKYFRLTTDINLYECPPNTGIFYENFDGEEHTIIMDINTNNNRIVGSLFGNCTHAIINNLNIKGSIKNN